MIFEVAFKIGNTANVTYIEEIPTKKNENTL